MVGKSHRVDLVHVTLVACSAALTTLFVTPWFNFDPINLPKMFILCTLSGSLTLLSIQCISKNYRILRRIELIFLAIFVFSLTVSFVSTNTFWSMQLWGTGGRSTGLFTYLAFAFLTLYTSIFVNLENIQKLLNIFLRTSYLFSAYVVLQYAEIDPIAWSTNAPVGTLGNINFMSAFLGFASIVLVSRLFNFFEVITLTAKLHYTLVTLLNLALIYWSGSIQGLAIFAAGLTLVIFFKLIRLKREVVAIVTLMSCSVAGLMIFLGTFGKGIFGKSLAQDSAIFRVDYWKAGIGIFNSSPVFGIGFDGYGEFYREFRDLAAVARTGPQRVTDTAHNIFLDLATSGGLVVLAPFLFLVVLAFWRIFRFTIHNSNERSDAYALAPLLLGWMVFSFISINQIGVGVWGFVFLGSAFGVSRGHLQVVSTFNLDKSSENKNKRSKNKNANRISRWKGFPSEKYFPVEQGSVRAKTFVALCGGLLGAIICLPPVITDFKFNQALKRGDVDSALSVIESSASTIPQSELVLQSLIDLGRETESLLLAKKVINRFPRNFKANVAIALNEEATLEEKSDAIEMLLEIDPHNLELRETLQKSMANTPKP